MGVRKVARQASAYLPLLSLLLAAISDFRRQPRAGSDEPPEVR